MSSTPVRKRKLLAVPAHENSASPSMDGSSNAYSSEPRAKKRARNRVSVQFSGSKTLSPSKFAPQKADILLTCGSEDNGVLGQGYVDEEREEPRGSTKPRRIDHVFEGVQILGVAATGMHTAVLTSDSQVFTAGCNDDGALGFPVKAANSNETNDSQINGSSESCDTSTTTEEATSPDATTSDNDPPPAPEPTDQHADFQSIPFPDTIKSFGNIIQIAAGDSHMAGLTDQGAVLVWGTYRGDSGRLGIRDWSSKPFTVSQIDAVPKLAINPNTFKCVKVCCGNDHTIALTQAGEVLSWGFGKCGQLGRVDELDMTAEVGDRELNNWLRPAKVRMPALGEARSSATKALNIWALGYSSFAQITNPKRDQKIIVAWGLNAYHQLGICEEEHTPGEHVWKPAPAQAFNDVKDANWTHIVGEQHVIACTDDGRVYGIGLNSDSHLGLGDEQAGRVLADDDTNYIMNKTEGLDGEPLETKTRARSKLVRINVPDDSKVVGVAASTKNSYAWTENGSIFSWGFSDALGLGSDTDTATAPTKIQSKHLIGFKVVHAAAGAQHLAIMAAKVVEEKEKEGEGDKMEVDTTNDGAASEAKEVSSEDTTD